jgi:hypothetical protein
MSIYVQLIIEGIILTFILVHAGLDYYSWYYKAQRIHLEILRQKFPKLGRFLFFDMYGPTGVSFFESLLVTPAPRTSFLLAVIFLYFFYYLQIRNGYDFSDRNIIALNVLFFFISLRALLIGQDLKRIIREHKEAESAEALTSIPPEEADAKHKTDA